MDLAKKLRERAVTVMNKQQDRRVQQYRAEEAAKAEFHLRIFDRARNTYSKCAIEAHLAVEERGDVAVTIELASGSFIRAEFSEHQNAWDMAVIALCEQGFKAKFKMEERAEPHELAGGMATLYTPTIYLEWD